jgi:hypothetical protein
LVLLTSAVRPLLDQLSDYEVRFRTDLLSLDVRCCAWAAGAPVVASLSGKKSRRR